MSVNTEAVRIASQAGNDVLLTHDFSFKIFAKGDISCYKVSAAGVYTLGVVDVDYTVAFNTDQETGTVTWVVAPVTGGYSIIIGDDLAMTQTTAIPREGALPAATIRNIVDKLTILTQQLSEKLGRALTQPLTPVNPTAVSVEAPVASRITAWNADGDALVSTTKTLTTFQDDVDNTAAAAVAAAASQATASAAAAAAQTAETNAETAETNAETAETNAAASAVAAAASAASIVGDVAAAEAARDAAQTAEANAETAETNAETAEAAAVVAKDLAVTAKNDAVTAKNAALVAQTAAELAETNAETAETNAELAETNAETAETAAEAAQAAAEAAATLAATYGMSYVSSANLAARPAAPVVNTIHYSVTEDQLDIYIVASAHWRTIG